MSNRTYSWLPGTLSLVALAALILVANRVSAQTVEEFYRRNSITLMVGAAAGGSSDLLAQIGRAHV